MQFPIRSTNERKLRSRYGNHLLRQASSGVPRQRKPIYDERLATLASLTGLVVGFVAALGFPAATLQFTHLGIPTDMLSYGRSLRAGIMPTVALIIGSIALLGVGKSLSRTASNLIKRRRIDQTNNQEHRTGNQEHHTGILVPYTWLALFFVYLLWFILFFLANLVVFVWPLFTTWRDIGSNFGFRDIVSRHYGFILGAVGLLFAVAQRLMMKWAAEHGPDAQRQRFVKAKEDAFEMPFFAGFVAFGFGAWHMLIVHKLQQILQEFGIEIEFFTMNVLLLIGAFFGLIAGAGFFWSFSLPAFASKNPRMKRLAWTEIVTYTLIAYIALVIVYSASVYWRMPDSIGGGSPQPVLVWIDSSGSQLDLNRQLPQAKCTLQGQQWMCTSAYLLDASGETLILVDGRTPNAHSLVIPLSKVQALTKEVAHESGGISH